MSNSNQFLVGVLAFLSEGWGLGAAVLYPLAMESLQDPYAPANPCFGCGPANEKGLRIQTFVADSGEEVVVAREGHPAFRRR